MVDCQVSAPVRCCLLYSDIFSLSSSTTTFFLISKFSSPLFYFAMSTHLLSNIFPNRMVTQSYCANRNRRSSRQPRPTSPSTDTHESHSSRVHPYLVSTHTTCSIYNTLIDHLYIYIHTQGETTTTTTNERERVELETDIVNQKERLLYSQETRHWRSERIKATAKENQFLSKPKMRDDIGRPTCLRIIKVQ